MSNNGNGFAPPLTGTDPLCGWPWVRAHRNDYTHAYIEGLSIAVSVNGQSLPAYTSAKDDKERRKEIKEVVRGYR